jgi:glutaminyl-peptide cyclotransferase
MKKYNWLAVIVLLLVLCMSCVDENKENLFSIDETGFKIVNITQDILTVKLNNLQNKVIDSVVYSINNKKMGAVKGNTSFDLKLVNQKLGYQELKAKVYFNNDSVETSTRIEIFSDFEPKEFTYTVLNTYPHDTATFTEGLEFYNDELYESAGQYGKSKLLKTDFKTGKIIKSLDLDAKYFGEGITFLNDKIYQLTYKEKVGFVYDAKTWKLEKTFPFDKTEGWGMTNDGKNLLFNDSSEKIWSMDTETLKATDFINVYSNNSKISEVNEIEYVEGKIFSNVWQKDIIVVINAATGAVEGVLDMKVLRKKVTNDTAEVLNGIAYNPKTKTIFVTGKNWNKLFEIKINK